MMKEINYEYLRASKRWKKNNSPEHYRSIYAESLNEMRLNPHKYAAVNMLRNIVSYLQQ